MLRDVTRPARRRPSSRRGTGPQIPQEVTRGGDTSREWTRPAGIRDRAYIISDGQIIKQGSPEEIAADPLVRETYLGEHFRLH